MKKKLSKSWRQDGDDEAFDHSAWETRASFFFVSSHKLIEVHKLDLEKNSVDLFATLVPSEFLISLAIEMMAKAYYLKHNPGPREAIYTHKVLPLISDIDLTDRQIELINHSEKYVVWAGRYPTPKWTKEKFKSDYDVPSIIKNGVEYIHADDIPNTASIPRIEEKWELYECINNNWSMVSNLV